MESVEGLELSPRKVEYLKYILERGCPVRTNDVAREFGVDPSTVTKALAELAGAGYVSHEPYHGVVLSGQGRAYAQFLIKRHRILALAFTQHGLSEDQACTEVSRFESLVSKDAIDRMCHAMGHPNRSGCGVITHDDGCLGHVTD